MPKIDVDTSPPGDGGQMNDAVGGAADGEEDSQSVFDRMRRDYVANRFAGSE